MTDAELEAIRHHDLNDKSFRRTTCGDALTQAEKDRAALLKEVGRLQGLLREARPSVVSDFGTAPLLARTDAALEGRPS